MVLPENGPRQEFRLRSEIDAERLNVVHAPFHRSGDEAPVDPEDAESVFAQAHGRRLSLQKRHPVVEIEIIEIRDQHVHRAAFD